MSRRVATIFALCAILLAAAAAMAQGAVRFDREWAIAGGAGGEIGDVALSPDGATVYVADPGFGATGRILVYDATGRLKTTYEGATGIPIERPAGLGVDVAGNLFVFESDKNRVVVIGGGRTIINTYAPTGADAFDDLATGITVDSQGLLYVADTRASRISVFNTVGTVVRQIPLGGSFPTDVAVDAAGNVYALLIFGTAGCESKVQLYDTSGARTAEWVVTQGQAFICARFGIAVDPRTSDVLVSGQSGTQAGVRRFSRTGALLGTTLTGNATPGDALKATGLAVDAQGAVYVRDANLPRILRFADLPPAPNLTATIPSPQTITRGPSTLVAPGKVPLRSLRTSKCIRTLVISGKPARVTVRIYSGIRSLRLFGQKTVRFLRAGKAVACVLVPGRAKTFDARTRMRIALGVVLGAGPVRGVPAPVPTSPTGPGTRPITLVP
jgi:DNA-binding beta-propeller fold protein YncE